MKLSELAKGRAATVARINDECASSERLAALGFLPGVSLKVVHVAPLGDPITIRMAGQEISVRLAEAAHLEVELAGE